MIDQISHLDCKVLFRYKPFTGLHGFSGNGSEPFEVQLMKAGALSDSCQSDSEELMARLVTELLPRWLQEPGNPAVEPEPIGS